MTARTPTQIARQWLDDFDAALTRRDIARVLSLFGEECYWRDLVAFTWNLKTLEGPDEIQSMLDATLDRVAPSNWQLDGEASEAGGVVEAWFTFETAEARGKGLLRLKDGRCWTLLTVMSELRDFPEPSGLKRPMGAEHGANKARETWLEARQREEAELGYERQPYCVIIGGGQGGIGLAARLRQMNVPTIVIEKNPRAGTPGATATSRCACTIRSGTTTCPTFPSRTTGRCSRRRTRSATGWRCTPR